MTAYGTIQSMASDANTFVFSPNPSSLTSIFQNIADDFGGARIVDDGDGES